MTVLVGYVPTPEGRAAVGWAAREAVRLSTRLLVLDSAQDSAQLDQVLAGLDIVGIEVVRRTIEHRRDPAEDILAVAEQEQVGLIVIGLRRRTPVGKLILGSNAQRILLEATCPVLAVKSEPDAV